MTHQPTMTIYDSNTGNKLTEIYFLSADIVPQQAVEVNDMNDNGYSEIKVSGYENVITNVKTEIRDSHTGEAIQ